MNLHPSEAGRNVGTKLQLRPERPVRKPRPRLARTDYVGRRTYHLTLTTAQRLPFLSEADVTASVETSLREVAEKRRFELLAYCFMPDHLHVLLRGEEESSDLLRLVQRFKQVTSFHFKQKQEHSLWQESFFDRVLRKDERAAAVAAYILDNPAAAGLPKSHPAYELRGGAYFDGAAPDGAKASSLHLPLLREDDA